MMSVTVPETYVSPLTFAGRFAPRTARRSTANLRNTDDIDPSPTRGQRLRYVYICTVNFPNPCGMNIDILETVKQPCSFAIPVLRLRTMRRSRESLEVHIWIPVSRSCNCELRP